MVFGAFLTISVPKNNVVLNSVFPKETLIKSDLRITRADQLSF